jgi:hypothetical protein
MYASMPASRTEELAERLNSRSYSGTAVVAGAAVLIITSKVLLAAIKRSVCTRGAPRFGIGLPSSAIKVNPATVADAPAPLNPVVDDPTIEGTCMRKPALTKRTRSVPVVEIPVVTGAGRPVVELMAVPAVAANREYNGLVLLNASPLMR